MKPSQIQGVGIRLHLGEEGMILEGCVWKWRHCYVSYLGKIPPARRPPTQPVKAQWSYLFFFLNVNHVFSSLEKGVRLCL